MADALLPSAFAELEEFAQIWSLPTEAERWDKRLASGMAEMQAFYDASFPRLEEAIEYCDKFSLDDMPEDAVHLLHLIYSLIMVAMAVEIFAQPKPTDSADAVIDRISEPVP
ncbi:MAG: hypothetical protein QOE41_3801 [Mycobacterium sp.]|jgi:hypothetical protein|nr:hypothetical protein [Mycobacterium sp.]MDT5134490.1 hypothetical protein [Mycobacterium sp.]